MTTSNKPSAALGGHMGAHMGQKTGVKPIARLDGSLLLARKGEAAPSVAATQHNNPALAWGAPAHPADYQPQTALAQSASAASAASAPPSQQPVASARLRPDSFQGGAFTAHGRGAAAYPQHHPASHSTPRVRAPLNQQRDPVALTLRVEDEMYLRLKYLAQHTGRSTQQVLAEALDGHLTNNGVPRSRKLVITST